MFMKMCAKARATMGALSRDERGVSAMEYVILVVIVVAAVAALKDPLTTAYESAFGKVTTAINTATQ